MATRIWQNKDSETSASSEDEYVKHDDDSTEDMNEIDLNENLTDDGGIMPDPDLLYPSSQYNDDLRTDSGPKTNPLVHSFDHVFWFGDLNFRINGTREVVDGMLENHMHDALLCNDQLTMLMRFNRIFSGFAEGPLNFFPTYKFDHDSGERLDLWVAHIESSSSQFLSNSTYISLFGSINRSL